MFEFDAGKLIIIGIVALIVIGPKELPRVLRQLGQLVGKMRRMAAEFQGQFMEAMREADMAEIETLAKNARADVDKLAAAAKIEAQFNPVADVRKEIEGALQTKPKEPAADDAAAMQPAESDSTRAQALPGPEPAALGQAAALGEAAAPEVSAALEPAGGEAPPAVINAEMHALATALKAEIETPSPTQPGAPEAPGDAAPAVEQGGAAQLERPARAAGTE